MENMTKGIHEKFCSECGSVINAKAEICPNCGVRQHSVSSKNRLAAALFAFFLGGFGVHKFYLGQVMMGLIYLLLCWTFIPSVIAFIEGIIYITMSDEAFAQKYC
ncbi:MAG: NINE protein [Deferribacterales bacterium]